MLRGEGNKEKDRKMKKKEEEAAAAIPNGVGYRVTLRIAFTSLVVEDTSLH